MAEEFIHEDWGETLKGNPCQYCGSTDCLGQKYRCPNCPEVVICSSQIIKKPGIDSKGNAINIEYHVKKSDNGFLICGPVHLNN